ncbi:MAG: hypothetical protein IJL41_06330 [Clostridia bacterium]|nr:hypothetical protein [Clostridia bacterium]
MGIIRLVIIVIVAVLLVLTIVAAIVLLTHKNDPGQMNDSSQEISEQKQREKEFVLNKTLLAYADTEEKPIRIEVEYSAAEQERKLDSFCENTYVDYDLAFRWGYQRNIQIGYDNELFRTVEFDVQTGKLTRFFIRTKYKKQAPEKLVFSDVPVSEDRMDEIIRIVLSDIMLRDDIDLDEYEKVTIGTNIEYNIAYYKKVNGIVVSEINVRATKSGTIWLLGISDLSDHDTIPVPDWDIEVYANAALRRIKAKFADDEDVAEIKDIAFLDNKMRIGYYGAEDTYMVYSEAFYTVVYKDGHETTYDCIPLFLFSCE